MSDMRFDRLSDVLLRDAWPHEARGFTPWLAENLNHIAEAIGVPLELDRTEVSVGSFYADILAKTPDGGFVLIENQLEQTDHTHLGQIMTYLAGLDAQTVIWIAPSFRDPHLTAIRWLNQHTAAAGFSFFALRLRVVRIGESPFAPIFEVVEKPSAFERGVREVTGAQGKAAAARVEFWTSYLDRFPDATSHGITPSGAPNKLCTILPGQLLLGRYIAGESCGVYLRGPDGSDPGEVSILLAPHRAEIEARLGETREGSTWFAIKSAPYSLGDRAHWPDAIAFLEEQSQRYRSTLADLFGGNA